MLPLVLYTGTTPWGSNRTLADLLGEPAAFHAFAPSWQPLFWNLADQTAEGLLASGEEWLQTFQHVSQINFGRSSTDPQDNLQVCFDLSRNRLPEQGVRNEDRLISLYQNLLGLSPDQVDRQQYDSDLRRVSSGRIADVVSRIVQSPTFQSRTRVGSVRY